MSQFTDTSRLGISGQVVARALDTGRPALVGYLPVGYPSVADSIAGMMPSVRLSILKASMASSSVTPS